VVTRRGLCRTAWYNEWCREVHVEPQAKVSLSDADAGFHRRRSLMIDLADDAPRAFGRRERVILELVRPSFARLVRRADAARERCRIRGVTRREVEVLGLVRDGLTNGEIASKLFISPTTVRSHLENAFAKLGAHTRTEAVAHLGRLVPIPHSESQPERPATLRPHGHTASKREPGSP
jgi:DNA-binding CsgD family transcriptional regulator